MREGSWSSRAVQAALATYRVVDHDAQAKGDLCERLCGVRGLATAITSASGDVIASRCGWIPDRELAAWLSESKAMWPRLRQVLARRDEANRRARAVADFDLATLRAKLGARHLARRGFEAVFADAGADAELRGRCARRLAELAIRSGDVEAARRWAELSPNLELRTRMRIALEDARPSDALDLFGDAAEPSRVEQLLAAIARHEVGDDAHARRALDAIIASEGDDDVARRAAQELRHLDEPGHQHGATGSAAPETTNR